MRLRWYQEEAVDSLFNYFETHGGTGTNGLPIDANPVVAMPTGTGKSLVIAKFFERALQHFPATRGVMSTHVKTLISQNAGKLREAWPTAPLGIYSAGLKKADTVQPIIFGGVKSMVGKWPIFSYRDFLVIDEGHLVSPEGDTSYQNFINELKYGPDYDPEKPITPEIFHRAMQSPHCNPYLKVIMLTASPYRLGLGHLTNGNIATDVAYDLCNLEGFNRLIAEGYISPLVPRPTKTEFDLTGVGIGKNDYNQAAAEAAVNHDKLTYACLCEVMEHGYNRRSWLVFASGVKHAEAIGEMLNGLFGIPTVVIHSKKSDAENDKALKAWQNGEVRCAVNMNSLTTGIDHPACDLIAMMRATISTGLWVQMLGRGTRPFYAPGYDLEDFNQRWAAIFAGGKQNCLVLDFARNAPRLGPINDPVIPRMKGQGPAGDAPLKTCDACGNYQHASVRACTVCGHLFPINSNLYSTSGTAELLRSEIPQFETYRVLRVVYGPHVSKATKAQHPGVPDHLLPFTIKVAYYCEGLKTFYDYVTVEGKGGNVKGRDWFRQRYPSEPPATNGEVLALVSQLRPPAKISVWVNTQYPRVMSHEF